MILFSYFFYRGVYGNVYSYSNNQETFGVKFKAMFKYAFMNVTAEIVHLTRCGFKSIIIYN